MLILSKLLSSASSPNSSPMLILSKLLRLLELIIMRIIEEIKEVVLMILKDNAPFVSCITRINGELIEDADDLDIVMSMYNLLEYSKNYRKTIGSLYNYYRDELGDDADDNNFDNINIVNSNTFKYKNKMTGNTYNVNAGVQGYDVNKNGTQEVELTIPLKYLGNFWRALNIPKY